VGLGLFAIAAFAVACSAAPSKKSPGDPGDPTWEDPITEKPLDPPLEAGVVEDDGGAFDLGGRESNASADAGGSRVDAGSPLDAGTPKDAGAPKDAGGPVLCSGPLAAGDVKVVEIMIAAQSGSGDKGEWIELQSTRQCTLNLKGLRIESPRGSGTDSATITGDYLLAPNGIFVVADSTSSVDNHGIGTVAASFNAADVLKNDGDTINVVSATSVVVDTITYPKFTLFIGRSVAFPWDCAWSDRSSWARWSWSFYKWNGNYQGTPNDDNFDVACF
jgi:hypothetical protein